MTIAVLPSLVAHRGFPARYPENTLAGIEAALRAGARYVEFDVQLCADGTPVVLHDATLARTAGDPRCVMDCVWSSLGDVSVHEPARFGPLAATMPLPSLAQLVDLLQHWPDAHALVELKTESLERFGVDMMMDRVSGVLAPMQSRCTLISFSPDAVRAVKRSGWLSGWVLRQADETSLVTARSLQPDLLFINYKRMPVPLWPGTWQWVFYCVQQGDEALTLAESGVGLIETDAIGDLLQHPAWREAACDAY